MEPLLQALLSGPVSGMTSHSKSQKGSTLWGSHNTSGTIARSSQSPTSFEESPNSRHIKGWERDLISLLMFNFLFDNV